MMDMFIIDNCVDEREFRNYVYSLLPRLGFEDISIDDTRVSDNDAINDNDMKASKNGMRYTIQTFLNTTITKEQIDETIEDMLKERTSYATIITNKNVDKDVKEKANENGIEIIDRDDLCLLVRK